MPSVANILNWIDSRPYDIVEGNHPEAAYYVNTSGDISQNYCPTFYPYSILMEPPCLA